MTTTSKIEQLDDDGVAQYGLVKILTIWAIVTIPMPILAFFVAPIIAERTGHVYGVVAWILLVGGMIWQFIVSLWILYSELEDFTWDNIKRRIWLQKPRDPKTGKASYKLFWWLIPAFLIYMLVEEGPVGEFIGNLILIPFPALADLPLLNVEVLVTPEYVGAWWLMALAIVSSIFNYFLGEELLFRGILLPKMRGAFGKWDWAANSVLFAFYHLHRPVQMLGFILGGFAWIFPASYFRSIWFTIILHAFEGIFLLVALFAVVSGLAFQ